MNDEQFVKLMTKIEEQTKYLKDIRQYTNFFYWFLAFSLVAGFLGGLISFLNEFFWWW